MSSSRPHLESIAASHCLIDNHRIAYGITGSGDPVVLIHGTPSSSLIWRKIAPAIASAGYRVHVFDLLGYGESERPRSECVDTSISAQVGVLEGLLAHWNLSAAHVVAHDIGGAVAQRFAIFAPERVRSLTMIDVVSFDSYPSARTRRQMASGLEKLARMPHDRHREHFRDWLLSAVANKARFEESGALDAFLDYVTGPVGQTSLFQHQVRHYDPKHTMEVAPRYAELARRPIQLIWGREDGWQVTDWAHRLNEAIPGSKLTILDDAGHFSPEDQPERISELVISFLDEHR